MHITPPDSLWLDFAEHPTLREHHLHDACVLIGNLYQHLLPVHPLRRLQSQSKTCLSGLPTVIFKELASLKTVLAGIRPCLVTHTVLARTFAQFRFCATRNNAYTC
jgi:hypothetical protein